MGIHYDYKSTRGDKAMKRRAKKSSLSPETKKKDVMHDIEKPITLEDLTNPDKS